MAFMLVFGCRLYLEIAGWKNWPMKLPHWLAAPLPGLTMALLANAQPSAVKLWPQITAGIYNHANVLAIKCELAEDGLTVTDAAWDSYPSYVNFYKEPLVRAKLSADGKTLLVLACNPRNRGVEQVRVRRPGGVEEYGFELVGDFPIIKRFPVTKP